MQIPIENTALLAAKKIRYLTFTLEVIPIFAVGTLKHGAVALI
jgi:hypothetical protein